MGGLNCTLNYTAAHTTYPLKCMLTPQGPVAAVLGRPADPYTRALLAAVPVEGVPRGGLASLPGSVPDLLRPPPGCRFAPRCPHARPACASGLPPVATLADGRQVACLRPGEGP